MSIPSERQKPVYTLSMNGEPDFKFRRKGMDIMSLHFGMFERGLLDRIDPQGAILGVVDMGQHGKMYGEWYDPLQGPRFDVALAATKMGEEQAARYLAMHENQRPYSFGKMGPRLVFQNHSENWGGKGFGMPYTYDIEAILPVEDIRAIYSTLPTSMSTFQAPFYMAIAENSTEAYQAAAHMSGVEVVVVAEEEYAEAGGGVMTPSEPVPDAVSTLARAAHEETNAVAIVLPPSVSPDRPWLRFIPLRSSIETDHGSVAVSHLVSFDSRSQAVYSTSSQRVVLPTSYTDSYAPKAGGQMHTRIRQLEGLVPTLRAAGLEPTGRVGVSSWPGYNRADLAYLMDAMQLKRKQSGVYQSDYHAHGVRPGYGVLAIGGSTFEIAPLSGTDGDSLVVHDIVDSPRGDKYVALKAWSAFHAGHNLGGVGSALDIRIYGGVIVKSTRDNSGVYTHVVLSGDVSGRPQSLEGLVFKPFLGGLGPIESSFLINDSMVTFELVGTQAELYESSASATRPRPSGDLDIYGELVNESSVIGYRDIVWCEVRLGIVKTWTRLGLEGLEFLSSGAGVIKPFPEEVKASYTALGKELDGEFFSMVELERPWPVPSEPVTRLDVYNRYRKAKEKACKRNDFLDQPYAKGKTWGQAQRELEKRGALGACYMVSWKTAVSTDPALELPKKVVLTDATNTTAAYAEVDWGDGKGLQRVKPGDYDKVGYWLKSGVPYSGPLSVVRQGAGLDVDFDPSLDATIGDNDFWSSPNSTGWGVGAANGTVFAAEAYSQSGFADLTTMVGEAPIKAALASVNLFGHTGAQLSLVFKKIRKDVPASVMSRGRKIAVSSR